MNSYYLANIDGARLKLELAERQVARVRQELRRATIRALNDGHPVNEIARHAQVTRQTIWEWSKPQWPSSS